MNTRKSRRLGAAAGGLLGAAFLPAAVAFADGYDFVPDPGSTETVTGLFGLSLTFPAIPGSFQGYQLFDVVDTSTGQVVGTFYADEATVPDLLGGTNNELLVTSVESGTAGTGPGNVPPVGSMLDTLTFGDSASSFANSYSDLASTTPGADVISDTLVTPFGNLDLSWLFGGFDAAAGLAAHSPRTALPPDIVPDPAATQVFTAISGLPPGFVTVQGYQPFDVVDTHGNVVGTFDADETTTSDIFGFNTQALLVTADVSGNPGTAPGDVPPVGSVFNTVIFAGFENIYSDLASTTAGGDVISDTLVTPFGNLDLSWLVGGFDAAAGLAAHSPGAAFLFGDDYHIAPDSDSAETFTGINGLPPGDVSIQGFQLFDVVDANGNVVGTFNADETTVPDMLITHYSQTLLVTSDVSGNPGTGPGDVPPVGSVFNTAIFAGFENIYSDLASTAPGGDVISDTLVTPFGNVDLSWLVGGFDAAAGLADVSYADGAWAGIFSPF